MALNKTPSSHSGYFGELTASAGKQNNFLFPVRIKMTPNTSVRPLSDSKKNSTKMMQPVLIKDLFPSSQKDRQNTAVTSVSTQKKKARSQRLNQPYLNTQSCYKPKKNEVEESTLFDIKSSGGSKVRRQLYQTLDSPQKFGLESKENTIKILKTKKIASKPLDETVCKSDEIKNKARKSYLLPPNTIKNSFLGKSGSNLKTLVKQTIKGNTSNIHKNSKNTSQQTGTQKQTIKSKNIREVNSSKSRNSLSHSTDNKKHTLMVRDNYTMTSPTFIRKSSESKLFSNLEQFERPSVIISPARRKSCKPLKNSDDLCLKMQNLNVSRAPCNCTQGVLNPNTTQQIIGFDVAQMSNGDQNGLLQLKPFLEQSLQISKSQVLQLKHSLEICENQILQLEKAINCINHIIIEKSETEKTTAETNLNLSLNNHLVENTEVTDKSNMSCTITVSDIDSSPTINNKNLNMDGDKSTEKINLYYDISVSPVDEEPIESTQVKSDKKLPIPIKILVNDADLHQESSELSLETFGDTARLSTIGEVSCEFSCEIESKKDEKDCSLKNNNKINRGEEESENKENVDDSTNTIMQTPRTPKTCRSIAIDDICNSQRRRSARLAAKSMSQSMLSDSEKQDSFTLLENELNVVHNPPPSKSLPASPMKATMTPSTTKQWDKRVQRPLKEYMALKMNGSFLVTPDVKKFQSCLEPTDTPHSRKSLSRKIFLELCDLYADSPEHN